jgi:hypothetical protein
VCIYIQNIIGRIGLIGRKAYLSHSYKKLMRLFMSKEERSAINKAAYSIGRLLPDLIRQHACLLKECNKPIKITIDLAWDEKEQMFVFVNPDEDKF